MLLTFLPAWTPAQISQRPWRMVVVADGEYLDLLRQRTDRYRAIVLGRRGTTGFAVSNDVDSVFLSLEASDFYGAIASHTPPSSISFHPAVSLVRLGWAKSYPTWGLGTSLLMPTNGPFRDARGEANLRISQWAPVLEICARASTDPSLRTLSATLNDYAVKTRNENEGWTAWIRATSMNEHLAGAALEVEREQSRLREKNGGYSARGSYDAWSVAAEVFHRSFLTGSWVVRASYSSATTSAGLAQDGVSFGDAPSAPSFTRMLTGNGRLTIVNRPTDVEVAAASWNGTAVGAIESWPFTPLAATVFSNRLNIRATGRLKGGWMRLSTPWDFDGYRLRTGATIAQLWTDADVAHWEPEFLIFGVKNYALERLRITSALLMGIHVDVRIPLNHVTVLVKADQFAPLTVGYRSAGGTGAAAGTSPRITTDGGRRIRVTLEWRPH